MKLFFRAMSVATLALVATLAVAQSPTPTPQPVPEIPLPTPAAPSIDATSWVLMDYASGNILASKEPDKRVEPASITKIMTDYVVSAEIANGKVHLDDPVFISENAWRSGGAGTDGSTSFLKVNSKVPLKDLLYGMIIQSGNDSAIALAEHVAGSEATFAQLMNAYAKRLGMAGSHFANASGYPADDHYMTARDVAVLSRALIHDFPDDYAISAIKQFEWNGITQHNRNTLLWRDPSVDGIKTGHTSAAGFCLAASAKRGDQRMIAIVMGAPSDKARSDDAQALLNYGFRFFETHKVYQAGKPLATPALWKGETDTLPVGVADDVLVTVPRGQYDKLKASLDLPAQLIAPFKKGQAVGHLVIKLDGKTLVDKPLLALQDAPEGGILSRTWDSLLLWWQGDDATTASEP
ncbi:MAG TPA: D-alanyl-D-alanine carboxypeptidase family protein [Rhodanobacteraceae bacterium]|nr:D-alanyl-D-alanine carboxypeptidase family protein [Rhodanobacteraceae bacterium]